MTLSTEKLAEGCVEGCIFWEFVLSWNDIDEGKEAAFWRANGSSSPVAAWYMEFMPVRRGAIKDVDLFRRCELSGTLLRGSLRRVGEALPEADVDGGEVALT